MQELPVNTDGEPFCLYLTINNKNGETIMSSQITTAFVQQYSANIQMLSQQMGSLLRDKVRLESVVGKNAFFDQVGSVTAQLKKLADIQTLRKLIHLTQEEEYLLADYEFADLIDQQDKVRLLIDPTSSYAQAAAMAMGRAMDDVSNRCCN